jgi:hypothetical protein
MVKRTVARMPVDTTLRHRDKNLKLSTDVMHVDGQMFLISVADPLNLTLQSKIESESRTALGLALQGHLAVLRSRDFNPRVVYVDPHSSFRAMTQDFPGVEIDVGGTGDYVAKVDAKTHRIKETYRKVKHGLPWKLPKRFVPDLVGYAVSRLNIRRTQVLSGNTCPRVLFTGIPVPYSELSVAFRDYVASYKGTDNTSETRSAACIVLCPVGNSTGSWTLWKLSTHMKVRRTNFQKLVTSELVIRAVNALTDEEAEQPVIQSEIESRQSTDVEPVIEHPTEEIESQPEAEEFTETVEMATVEAEAETEQVRQEVLEAAPEDTGELRTRSGREVRRPTRFMAVTKVSRSEWGEAACQVAIKLEVRQLFDELKALRVVWRAEISRSTKVLQSHMFLVRKYLADGAFDKVKA